MQVSRSNTDAGRRYHRPATRWRCGRSRRRIGDTGLRSCCVDTRHKSRHQVSRCTYNCPHDRDTRILRSDNNILSHLSVVSQSLWSSSKYVGPPYCRAEMYAGRVTVSHGVYADRTDRPTDGRTLDRYITHSAIDAASVINLLSINICIDRHTAPRWWETLCNGMVGWRPSQRVSLIGKSCNI